MLVLEDSSGKDQRGRCFLQAIYNVCPAAGEQYPPSVRF